MSKVVCVPLSNNGYLTEGRVSPGEDSSGSARCSNNPVKPPGVALVVLKLMDVTEVAQLCFQEVVAEAKIQVVEEGSEDKISLEMDFSL